MPALLPAFACAWQAEVGSSAESLEHREARFGLEFDDRGTRSLNGEPGEWRRFSVLRRQPLPAVGPYPLR